MKRYVLTGIALITVIYGCAFGAKPWETGRQESPLQYDPSMVQTSGAGKPPENPSSLWQEGLQATTDSIQPVSRSTQPETTPTDKPVPAKAGVVHVTHTATSAQELGNGHRYPIDLPTVLRLAGANHLDIALFREKVHEAYANAIVAMEEFVPTLNPGLRFERREGKIQSTEGPIIDVDAQQTFIGGNIVLDWELGDAIFSTLAEMQRYHASQAALEAKVHDAILEAAIAYFELVKGQAQVAISEQAVEISEKLVRQTEASVLQGLGFKGDILRAKAQLSSNRLAITVAKESLKITSVRLSTILRLDPGIELYSAERVAIPIKLVGDNEKLLDLVKKAVSQRPELKEAYALISGLEDEYKGTVWGPLIPSFRAEAGAGGLGHVPDDLSSREDYKFSLGWKIGPGGLFDMGRKHLIKSKYESQRIHQAKLIQKIEEDVRVAYTQVQAKAEQMKIAEGGVADATESLKLNQERQKMGIGIPLEVLQAEDALTQARLDHLSAIIQYNKSQYILFTRIGTNPINGVTGN